MKKLTMAGFFLLAVVVPALAGDLESVFVPRDDHGLSIITASPVPAEVVSAVGQKEDKPEANLLSKGIDLAFQSMKKAVAAPVRVIKDVPSSVLGFVLGKKEKKASQPAPVEAAKAEPAPGDSIWEAELDTWVEVSLASFEPNAVKAKEPNWDRLEYVRPGESIRNEEIVPTKGNGLGNDTLKAQILLQAMIESEGKE
jgi:hypothetical protein